MRFILLSLLAVALCAGDAPSNASTTKVDAAYRAYLTAMAKAHQIEFAKFDAALKKETAAAKKDPTLAAIIEAALAKVKSGKALTELLDPSGGVFNDEKLAGGVESLYGKWSMTTPTADPTYEWSVTIKPNGVAIFINGSTSAGKTTSTSRWAVVGSCVQIQEPYNAAPWLIQLPAPMGKTVNMQRTTKTETGERQEIHPITRMAEDALPGVK